MTSHLAGIGIGSSSASLFTCKRRRPWPLVSPSSSFQSSSRGLYATRGRPGAGPGSGARVASTNCIPPINYEHFH